MFDDECRELVETYLTMEDPKSVHPIGLELRLSAEAGSLALRGIIDRLELRDGELVVTDYKTGRAPSVKWEQKSLAGVHFYSFLCEEVLGRRPVAIRLMYLSSGETIEATPSEQSVRFITTRTTAVWNAIERACVTGDFKSRPGAMCASCSFQPWCPSFGGDPERAAVEAPVAHRPGAGRHVTVGHRPTIDRFDAWADKALEHLRGQPVADAVFTSASHLGDFSLIWHLANVVRGLTSDRRANQVPALALALGAESLLVNQGLKRLFGRSRPTVEGDPRFPVRRPLTSSFPSGHASAAAFTAALLTAWDGRRSAPFWWTVAAIVATSRAYVRIHHASDVVAGMAVGAVLGVGAGRFLRRLGIS